MSILFSLFFFIILTPADFKSPIIQIVPCMSTVEQRAPQCLCVWNQTIYKLALTCHIQSPGYSPKNNLFVLLNRSEKRNRSVKCSYQWFKILESVSNFLNQCNIYCLLNLTFIYKTCFGVTFSE